MTALSLRREKPGTALLTAYLRALTGPEIIARLAVTDIELIADNGKPHGVCAEQKLAVFDGVKSEQNGWNLGRSSAVPTGAMPRLGVVHLACCGT